MLKVSTKVFGIENFSVNKKKMRDDCTISYTLLLLVRSDKIMMLGNVWKKYTKKEKRRRHLQCQVSDEMTVSFTSSLALV